MKKLLLIITILLSFSMFGQIRETKNSRKLAEEMARVLELSDAQAQKIYEIRLKYLNKMDKIRVNNLGSREEDFKNLIKPEIIAYKEETFAFLGEEKQNEWEKYNEKKRANLKK